MPNYISWLKKKLKLLRKHIAMINRIYIKDRWKTLWKVIFHYKGSLYVNKLIKTYKTHISEGTNHTEIALYVDVHPGSKE
jgi:hypothetical protein